MEDDPENKIKMPKIAKVKNKMPAPVQITAEQLLREAKERELELVPPPPKQKISDPDELAQYKLRKRKAFEDNIRKNRTVMSNWIKYATWEESQKEIQRARSVWERALDVDHRNITLWLKYAEMEMKNKQINHARNLWDRAVTILPRANQLWYKYTYMEEMLGNIAGVRQVFERWMEWQPGEQAWHSYINFELRCKELDRARIIYEKFVIVHPDVKNWIKYARFEDKNGYISSARRIFERGIEFFGEDNLDEQMLIAFAKFEEKQKEHERARVIYKYGLDHLAKEKCEEIYKCFTIHEKKFGSRAAIEDVIVSKRRFHYEEEVKNNPNNYDAWFDYMRLLESDGDPEVVRETYERAIANLPLSQEKRFWRRYIYLWINYALYEELEMEDVERTREVYRAALDILPHKRFTFAKLWIMYSHFEVRQKDLPQARKIMGAAIGKCPKTKLFRGYIDLEIQLREFERCRILYEKFIEFNPGNCSTWIKYAELESILGDIDRARAVYELATNQISLDMPEVLWKSYIDFEIAAEEFDLTRELYRRLLQRTQHVKVWISFAQFEKSLEEDGTVDRARAIYKEANNSLKSSNEKEERLMLLESWQEFEDELGDDETRRLVAKMMPQKVKKRRKIQTEDQMDAGWEEFYDYIFPDDEAAQPNLKLLAMAKRWKERETTVDDSDDVSDHDVGDDEVGHKDVDGGGDGHDFHEEGNHWDDDGEGDHRDVHGEGNHKDVDEEDAHWDDDGEGDHRDVHGEGNHKDVDEEDAHWDDDGEGDHRDVDGKGSHKDVDEEDAHWDDDVKGEHRDVDGKGSHKDVDEEDAHWDDDVKGEHRDVDDKSDDQDLGVHGPDVDVHGQDIVDDRRDVGGKSDHQGLCGEGDHQDVVDAQSKRASGDFLVKEVEVRGLENMNSGASEVNRPINTGEGNNNVHGGLDEVRGSVNDDTSEHIEKVSADVGAVNVASSRPESTEKCTDDAVKDTTGHTKSSGGDSSSSSTSSSSSSSTSGSSSSDSDSDDSTEDKQQRDKLRGKNVNNRASEQSSQTRSRAKKNDSSDDSSSDSSDDDNDRKPATKSRREYLKRDDVLRARNRDDRRDRTDERQYGKSRRTPDGKREYGAKRSREDIKIGRADRTRRVEDRQSSDDEGMVSRTGRTEHQKGNRTDSRRSTRTEREPETGGRSERAERQTRSRTDRTDKSTRRKNDSTSSDSDDDRRKRRRRHRESRE